MDKQKLEFLNAKSDEIRKILIEMIGRLGVGHVGGSLSVVDLLTVLYYDVANVDPKSPRVPRSLQRAISRWTRSIHSTNRAQISLLTAT